MRKTVFLLIGLLALSGCGVVVYERPEEEEKTDIYDLNITEDASDGSYQTTNSTIIDLGNEDVKISRGGTYILQGEMEDAGVTVEVNSHESVHIVLNGVDIRSNDFAGIYIIEAGKVMITLAEGTSNSISDSSAYSDIDGTGVDALIYSKADLIVNGSGSLSLNSPDNHGIVSKDDLIIAGGSFSIDVAGRGLSGKDRLMISDGEFTIRSGKDALKSDNSEEEGRGYIHITGGTFDIHSTADAVYGYNLVNIEDGSFTIETSASADTNSAKGIKSDEMIMISGGDFSIDSVDDGIHSERDVTISGGTIRINTEDDGIHADRKAEIDDGEITIDASEGIEATYVLINGGNISINASDDGINATQKVGKLTPTIEVNGGYLKIVMAMGDTDGFDSNGYIYINGGTVDVSGINTFDCGIEQVFNGGTVIVNGEEVDELPEDMIHNPNDIPGMTPPGFGGEGKDEAEDFGDKEGFGDEAPPGFTPPTEEAPGSDPPKEKPKGDKPGRH